MINIDQIETMLNQNVGFFQRITGQETSRITNITKTYINTLDALEKDPNCNLNFDAYALVMSKLDQLCSKEARELSVNVKYRFHALCHRAGNYQDHNPSITISDLREAVQEWKNKYELYEDKTITAKETKKLEEVLNYQSFAVLLVGGNDKFKDDCFKWIIRDNNSVEALVKFPGTCKKIKSCLLAGRIGRFAATSLKVENNDVTLPFEVQEGEHVVSRRISILDEKRVVNLRGNYSLTIEAIFQVFKNKNITPGNIEYFGQNGITNFSVNDWGWWNPEKLDYERVDLNKANWWLDLPVYEILSKMELRQRFKLPDLLDDNWVPIVRSTTESLRMDIDKSHGFIGIAIPLGDGTWRIYDFGKYADWFPNKLIEKFFMLGNTVRAKIACFDENDIYPRLQAKTPLLFTPEQGLKLMDEIKEDIIRAREGNIVFQFAWENCAYWPADLLKRVLKDDCPNFFRAPANIATPKIQPLSAIFSFIRKSAEWIQKIAFRALEYLLLGWRYVDIIEKGQRIRKCVFNSGFHETCEMYHPALNHHNIRTGVYPGVNTFGFINIEHAVA